MAQAPPPLMFVLFGTFSIFPGCPDLSGTVPIGPSLADWNLSSTELESENSIGAFLQARAPVLDKISGPMGAQFLSSTGLQSENLIETAQSSQYQHWIKIGLPFPEGPGIEKIHSRSNAWKNHSPTHEIFILAWNFHSRFEIFILDWKFQSRALFFCAQRGARNEKTILDWKFHSVLKAWFFQYRLSRLKFFNPGALFEVSSLPSWGSQHQLRIKALPSENNPEKMLMVVQGQRRAWYV